jgi:hypothetical protein
MEAVTTPTAINLYSRECQAIRVVMRLWRY